MNLHSITCVYYIGVDLVFWRKSYKILYLNSFIFSGCLINSFAVGFYLIMCLFSLSRLQVNRKL